MEYKYRYDDDDHYDGTNNPKYIVVHDTGNYTDSDEGNANYFCTGTRNASAHLFVDSDSCTQVVRFEDGAFHCGDGNGKYGITNNNSIGIEMCRVEGVVTEQTELNTISIVKDLMGKFNIPIERVVRHYDASRKNCPSSFNLDGQWTRWYNFKSKLSSPLTNAQISKLTANGKMITGESITFEATADTDLYKFTLQRKSNGEWINASNWQSSNKCQWTFTTEGDYLMSCQVKRNGSTKEYDNYEHVHFSVKARKKSKVESFIVEGNKEANSPLVFKTVASEDSEYKYWIYDYEANQWMKMIDYSYYSEFKHTFTSKKKFRVVVHVRNKYSTNDYDDRGEIELDFTKEDHSNCEHKIDELNGKIKTLEEINKELQKKLEDIKNIVK